MEEVGVVRELWRYPVKSLVGESLPALDIDSRGVRGDRLWALAVAEGKFASGKSTSRFRRVRGMLHLSSRYDAQVPVITFPDGRAIRGDDPGIDAALSAHFGEPLRLVEERGVSHLDEGPVHLVTTSSLRTLQAQLGPIDVRRFRPNVVLDTPDPGGTPEAGWVGRTVGIGNGVVLEVTSRTPRCIMVGQAQRALTADPRILPRIANDHDLFFGVMAAVRRTGHVRLGDRAVLEAAPS